jgi:anti-sigma B factor antagonist
MEIHETKTGEVLVVALQGHLDTVSSTPLEDRLRTLVEEGARQMVLDLSGVDYVNSSGLKAILVTAKQIETAGGKLVLCGLSPNVMMIFDMIGFSRILNILPGREEAVRSLEADGAAA